MRLVRADCSQINFDQADLNGFLLQQAYKCRLQNIRSFWVLLHGYDFTLRTKGDSDFFQRFDGHHSLVFRVKSSRTGKLTTRYEYHTEHGGLYRLNVEEVLQTTQPYANLGHGFSVVDVLAVQRDQFPQAVELSRPEEVTLTGDLYRVFKKRQEIFYKVNLGTTTHVSAKGIASAHQDVFASRRCDLLVIDSDFLPDDNPDLLRTELSYSEDSPESVHIWYSRNPVNNLVYGHGGVKLFPREAQLKRRTSNLHNDFTMSVGAGLVIHPVCLGTHAYNWSSFSTWITAAKETAKLTLAVDENRDMEAKERLDVWLSVFNPETLFVGESRSGALFGYRFPHSVLSADTNEKQKALFRNNFEGADNG